MSMSLEGAIVIVVRIPVFVMIAWHQIPQVRLFEYVKEAEHNAILCRDKVSETTMQLIPGNNMQLIRTKNKAKPSTSMIRTKIMKKVGYKVFLQINIREIVFQNSLCTPFTVRKWEKSPLKFTAPF